MTKRKQRPGRSFIVDRRIRGIGRIRHATGLQNAAQFRLLNDHITEAAKTVEGRAVLALMVGKHPQLRADVFFRYAKAGELHLIPQGNAARPLVEALKQWHADTESEVSTDTHRVRNELVTWVTALAPANAMVPALPDVIRQLRVRQAKAPRSFNLNRSYALAFVRDTIGKLSPIYLAVQAVPVRKVKPKVKPCPMSPADLLRLREGFDKLAAEWLIAHDSPKATKRPRASWADAFVMCLTGMNPKEYHGQWRVLEDRVVILGTKRIGRVRAVPRLIPASALWGDSDYPRPSVSQRVYSDAFRAAADAVGLHATPYDCRRSFANWMEAAAIPRTRRMLYLGHGAKDVTDLYERHEVDLFIVEDGTRLRKWIEQQLTSETTPVPEISPDAI